MFLVSHDFHTCLDLSGFVLTLTATKAHMGKWLMETSCKIVRYLLSISWFDMVVASISRRLWKSPLMGCQIKLWLPFFSKKTFLDTGHCKNWKEKRTSSYYQWSILSFSLILCVQWQDFEMYIADKCIPLKVKPHYIASALPPGFSPFSYFPAHLNMKFTRGLPSGLNYLPKHPLHGTDH